MPTQSTHRIAVRDEGAFIRAYWAPLTSMDGAEVVATISREACVQTPQLFDAFLTLAQAMSVTMTHLRLGAHLKVVDVAVMNAPAHEVGGHA